LVPVARKMFLLAAAFFFFCKMKVMSKYRVYVLPHAQGQVFDEARSGTINFFIDTALLLLVIHFGWIPTASNTVLNMVATYACMFVWFEFWFYFTHRAYHSKALYFIHAQHHLSRVTTPFAAFSFSIIERSSLNLGAIGFAIVYSHLLPFSIAGFIVYCVSSNVMNVLLHCNVEIFPAGFARNPVLGWIFTPTFHAMHHARYLRHYGLFTTIPDRMFNTLWPDYAAVQERAARGEGLTAFHEKVKEGEPVATGGEPRGVLAYPVSE
jgi:sterol desaturase/sphingolipid hydroxylase (fatty acid hydroxylase superfamily)